MRVFSSSRFVSCLALFLATTIVSTSTVACSSASQEESIPSADMSAALEDSTQTVTITNSQGQVVWRQTASLDGVTQTKDAQGRTVIELANGDRAVVTQQLPLPNGLTRMTIAVSTGLTFSMDVDAAHGRGSGVQPQGFVLALIAGVVLVIVVGIAFASYALCIQALGASQAACVASGRNWSGRCTGGGVSSGFQYTLESTCTGGDPRPGTPPGGTATATADDPTPPAGK